MKHTIRLTFVSTLILLFFGVVQIAFSQKKEDNKKALEEYARKLEAEDIFTEGMRYALLDKYDKAIERFETAKRLSPGNAGLLFKLSEIQARLNRMEDAVSNAKEAIEIDPKNSYYYNLLAQLYERQGDFKNAAKTYEALMDEIKGNEDYLFPMVNSYLALGDFKKALKILDKVEKKFGLSEELIRQKQQLYLRLNKLNDALDEGERLIKSNPNIPSYYIHQATLLGNNQKMVEAEKYLRKAIEIAPDKNDARLRLFELLRFQKKNNEAEAMADKAFADPDVNINDKVGVLAVYLDPNISDIERSLALKLVSLTCLAHPNDPKAFALKGDILSQANKNREAQESYLKATTLPGVTYAVWEQIIRIDIENEQIDSLSVHTAKAVELYPNQAVMWYYNGRSLLMLNKKEDAIKSLERARKLVVNNNGMLLEINAMLGDTYHGLNRHADSDEAFEEALKLDPNNDHVLNNYAYFLSVRRVNLDKAKSMGLRLMKIKPDLATYQDTYGWILFQLKEYEEAKKYLELASRNTQSGTIFEHYGDVLFQLGEVDKAIEQWRKAKNLGGDVSPFLDKKIANRQFFE